MDPKYRTIFWAPRYKAELAPLEADAIADLHNAIDLCASDRFRGVTAKVHSPRAASNSGQRLDAFMKLRPPGNPLSYSASSSKKRVIATSHRGVFAATKEKPLYQFQKSINAQKPAA
jgi:hypothetical protein